MPKMKLETLEAKQKIYLKMIVDLQKDLDKITNSIKSAKAKSPDSARKAKPAPKKGAKRGPAKRGPAKKAAPKAVAAKKAPAKKRARAAKSADKAVAKPAAQSKE